MKEYYLIGSLRNPEIPRIAKALRDVNINVFDSWFAAGPNADDCWREYEKNRGLEYSYALKSYAAQHVFKFDHTHLNRCDGAILVYPAGKSAHLELGYMIGKGKPGYVLIEQEPERWDVMLNFATAVCMSLNELIGVLK